MVREQRIGQRVAVKEGGVGRFRSRLHNSTKASAESCRETALPACVGCYRAARGSGPGGVVSGIVVGARARG